MIRRGRKRCIAALAHKLIAVIYSVLNTQQPYLEPDIDSEAVIIAKHALRALKALQKYVYLSPASTHRRLIPRRLRRLLTGRNPGPGGGNYKD